MPTIPLERPKETAKDVRAVGKRNRVVPSNPLKADPTRTTVLRETFVRDLSARFLALKSKIVQLLVEEDVFGLRPSKTSPLTGNVTVNTRWRFLTNPQQVGRFEQWLQTQISQDILGNVTPANLNDAYWSRYIEQGYRKGAGRAFDDTRAAQRYGISSPEQLSFYQGTREEFLRQAFAQPISRERLELLTGRVYTGMKGVTEQMASSMTRTLADGLVQGQHPRQIATALNKATEIGRKRARVIARTEIVRAHAEGQLDHMEQLGVTKVGVMAEWSTVGSDACPMCAPMEGVVLKVSEAKGAIPRHPNCRCAWVPANVGESKIGQVRTKAKIEKQLDKSIAAEISEKGLRAGRTLQEQYRLSQWAGADINPAAVRPTPIVDRQFLKKIWDKAKQVGAPVAKIGNAWPELAKLIVKEAGFSDKTAKIALGVATLGDFALPGVPAGSWLVSLLASIKSPGAAPRVIKQLAQRLKKVVRLKLRERTLGVGKGLIKRTKAKVTK